MQEREMTKKEKAKEKRLKKKYDDSGMKASMKKQYGDDWEQVYFATIRKKAMGEGYKELPPIDRDRYQERPGLEGPFQTMAGKVVYYDPQEGAYYDPDTDMYLSYDEFKALDNDRTGMETEGHSPHPKGSAKYKKHMAAMHANSAEPKGKMIEGVKRNILYREIGKRLAKGHSIDSIKKYYKDIDDKYPGHIEKIVQALKDRNEIPEASMNDDEIDAFHRALDALVHKHLGHGSHEKDDVDESEKRWKSTSMSYDDAVEKYGKENVKKGMFKRGTGEDDVQVFVEDSNDPYGGAIDRAVARVLGNARAQQSGAPATSPRPRLRPNNFPTVDLTPDAEAGDQVHIRPRTKPMPRPRLRPQNIGSNPRTGATRGIDPRDNYSPADLQRLLNQPGMSEGESNPYIVVHAKKGKLEIHADTSYEAAKKAAKKWGLKSTAGIDAHLAINELEIPGTDYSIPDAAVAAAAAIKPPVDTNAKPKGPSPKNTARRANARGMSLVSDRPTAATSRPTGNLSAVQGAGKASWGSRALGALGRLASRASLPAMILTPTQMGDGTISPEMQAELERLEAQRRRSMGEMRESLQFNEEDNNSISDNETVAIYVRTMLDESHNNWDKVKEQVHVVLDALDENHTADAQSVLTLLRTRNIQESVEKQIMLKENIDTLKKIVADKSVMPVKFSDGTMRVDLTTASIFLSVYDKQKPEIQEKMQKMMKTKAGFVKLLDVIYSKAK